MTLGWASIIRIGLVQTALGAVVVLCTATINRVMIVELSLLAVIPAMLVGLYHGFQLLRPKWGHGADKGGRRTPWILGGMAVLATGTVGAATATAWMETAFWPGLALAIAAFTCVGLGLGASATNLLAMLAAHVAPERKTAAGSLVWILMIAGLAASGITIGQVLDPYSGSRLIQVSLCVAVICMAVTTLALWGLEKRVQAEATPQRSRIGFSAALREVWDDPKARIFTIFVFVAMLAYNTQDLILEPFGGHVFGMTPGESTALGGMLHAGALMGMLLVFGTGLIFGGHTLTRVFMIGGCIGSGLCLLALGLGGASGPGWPITANVMALGFSNGIFAVAAIGAMMGLASEGYTAREGTRMGVFGAAQSLGFALGATFGATALDVLRASLGMLAEAYAIVFLIEGALFLVAAAIAARAIQPTITRNRSLVEAARIPAE
ncbi:MAG: BCD family MFS transporter [Paracoccaceae bacterium]